MMLFGQTHRLRSLLVVGLMCAGSLLLEGCFARANTPSFDSTAAFEVLKKQCEFGVRPPGTDAHERCRDYLLAELKKSADTAELQAFEHKRGDETFPMWNVIGRFGSSDKPGILLCAHWDTRPTADQELEPADRKKPIIGANDGASGVAVLVQLARMFREKAPPVPVTIILFDGEDLGPKGDNMFLGAKHFASTLKKPIPYSYGILLDMIGDKDLGICKEWNSVAAAPDAVETIWNAARKRGHDDVIIGQTKYSISDDHVPLIRAGLPCVDMIDFDYPHWHTLGDTVDKCSPDSLRAVGETIAEVVYSVKP